MTVRQDPASAGLLVEITTRTAAERDAPDRHPRRPPPGRPVPARRLSRLNRTASASPAVRIPAGGRFVSLTKGTAAMHAHTEPATDTTTDRQPGPARPARRHALWPTIRPG